MLRIEIFYPHVLNDLEIKHLFDKLKKSFIAKNFQLIKYKVVNLKESLININSVFTEASGMNSTGVRDFNRKMCNIFMKFIKHNLVGSLRMLGYLLGNVRKNIERSLISIIFGGIFV